MGGPTGRTWQEAVGDKASATAVIGQAQVRWEFSEDYKDSRLRFERAQYSFFTEK